MSVTFKIQGIKLRERPYRVVTGYIILSALAQMVACLPLFQQVRGFDPRRGSKFSFENFQLRDQEGWRCTLSNRQIVHHRPGLNSKPFRSTYVEPGGPLGAFSRRAGYEPAPGFTFSLPFIIIIIPHNTITLHKQLHVQSP